MNVPSMVSVAINSNGAATYRAIEIDILSTSVVHQSVQHIDFSLKIQKPKGQ